MKLRETIRYEFASQARRPVTWLFALALLGLMVLFTTQAEISEAKAGDAPVNVPLSLAVLSLFGSLFALLPIAAIAGDAAGRDVQSRMTPLLYTTPTGEATYLGGRFLGALLMAAVLSLAIPAGVLIAVLASDADPALLGPVRALTYAGAWAFVTLPNVLLATSAAFGLAARRGRPMAGFVAVAVLFIATLACMVVLGLRFNLWTLAALLDPLGVAPLSEASRALTPAARRTFVPWLGAGWLRNRAIWMLVSAGILALTYRGFRFAHRAQGSAKRNRAIEPAAELPPTPRPITPRHRRHAFGTATRLRQLAAVAGESWRLVVLGWGGLVLVAIAAFVAALGPEMMEHIGVPLIPAAGRLASYLGSPTELLTIAPLMVVVYYAGELVWRDRDAGLGEIADAAPVPSWAYLLGRAGGLALALATFQALMLLAAVVVQLRMGHRAIEPWLHVRLFLGVALFDWLLWVAVAVAAHVIVAQKYVGHALMFGLFAFTIYASSLGIDHRLLVFAGDPGLEHTAMRGFGRGVAPWLAFQLYWGAWAALLLVAGALMWMRGPEARARARLALARTRLTRRATLAAGAAAALVLALGGFALWNTNVRNDYRSPREREALAAEYERRYRRYEALPQPLLDAVRLDVALYPRDGRATFRGSYRLVHRDRAPATAIHVTLPESGDVGPFATDRASTTTVSDDAHRYRILTLAEPLRRGDTLRLEFTMQVGGRGFTNDGADEGLTPNGTFLRSGRLPQIGYRRTRELSDRGKRLDHGLGPRESIPSLDDAAARGWVALAEAERITVETTVSTDGGERAVAPGALVREWTASGRNHFHYATERPIRNDWAIYSADYAVRRARWSPPGTSAAVDIEVFHHKGHAANVDTMVAGVQASLEHLSGTLTPYGYPQARFVEHPGLGGTLHAFPINVSYEEGFRGMNSTRDPRDVAFPFAIVAHEMAHHWWGDQLSPAPVEGSALLSESLAWYSAMQVVEHRFGRAHMERLVSILREAYLPPRAPSDPPLLQASGWFLAYRKGPLAMYALREYAGAERVTEALRRLLASSRAGEPPMPTTRDLYRELSAAVPDSLRPLVHDLFAANTVWQLRTDSVTSRPAPRGMVELTLDVRARKLEIDTAGAERDVPMDDLVEVSAFAADAKRADERGAPVYRRLHRVRTGTQRIVIVVPATAAWAGLDARQLLFDFEPHDNVASVVRAGEKRGRPRARFD